MKSDRRRIAVLGAGGSFGARFVEMALQRPDWEVVPVLRTHRSLARLSRFDLPFRRVQTADEKALADALQDCDVLVNASLGGWLRILPDTRVFHRAAVQAGVAQFVHLGSAAVFGRATASTRESDSIASDMRWYLYAVEKARADDYLRGQMEQSGPRIVILRPFLIWGARAGCVIGPARRLQEGRAWLTNEGAGICNLCYADNLARYIFRVIDQGPSACGCYNVSDAETVTWRQFLEALADGLGVPRSRVSLAGSSPLRPSLPVVAEWLKSRRVAYRTGQWLLANLSAETRSLLKWRLPFLFGPGALPPWPADAAFPPGSPPRLTRDAWTAQHTERKLPNEAFARDFGLPELTSFEEAMRATVQWLRLGGFALD